MKVKKTKRKLRSEVIAGFIFFVCGLLYVITTLFVHAQTENYTIQIQKAQNEIDEYKEVNANLSIEIQVLQNKDRVYTIAQESGLTQNQDNVISIN